MKELWDSSVWGFISLVAVLLLSMIIANYLKRSIKWLRNSLVPTAVLGGLILLVVASVYNVIVIGNINGEEGVVTFFNLEFFGSSGYDALEALTYHCLGIGFIAMAMKSSSKKFTKKRNLEIFDSGVLTVATYLIQGILGLGITILCCSFVTGLIPAAGLILPFGYGQGTGQALIWGGVYEGYGLLGGSDFGLTVAALGFLSASIGGVIYLNILRRKGQLNLAGDEQIKRINLSEVQGDNEVPLNGSIDKMTLQIGIVIAIYFISYLIMLGIGSFLPKNFKMVIFGFNFLIGVLLATLIKKIISILRKKNIMKRDYVNGFMMDRISGFSFDLMIVAGISVIRLDLIVQYWYVLLIMGVLGAFLTFFYVKFISKALFKEYWQEQFFAMYGMLTGTASTGMILLREIDPDFQTPAADNLVYQSLIAIIFGFPLMLMAPWAPMKEWTAYAVLGIIIVMFIILNIILFRNKIFRRNKAVESKQI